MAEAPQYDLIGLKMQSILEPLCDCIAEKLCECIKNAIQDFAQQPGAKPCQSFPFNFTKSIQQTAVCFTITTAFQVPRGMTGVITRISLQERYPGTLYGANFFLIINDNMSLEFPRIDTPVGGAGEGLGARICLEEQDMVSIMVQCSWTPAVFVGIESTYQQTIFPYSLEGYFTYKEVC